MSQRAASPQYGVPEATLSNRLTGQEQSQVDQLLDQKKVETEVERHWQEAAQCGFGMSRQQLLIRTGRLCNEYKNATS